jgi:hypothetical protein
MSSEKISNFRKKVIIKPSGWKKLQITTKRGDLLAGVND